MNTIAEKSGESKLWSFVVRHPVITTVLTGLVPGLGLLVGAALSWRYRHSRGLCLVLILITGIMTILWLSYFAWLGGSSSIHYNHPVKVP